MTAEGFAKCISWQNPEQEAPDLDKTGRNICFDVYLPPAAWCSSVLFLHLGHSTCQRSEVFGQFSDTQCDFWGCLVHAQELDLIDPFGSLPTEDILCLS